MSVFNLKVLGCIMAATVLSSQAALAAVKVGITMPTQNIERWYLEGPLLSEKLKAAGYEPSLYYGGDADVALQVSQVHRMISEGCSVLVIAPIDGNSFKEALKEAKAKHIPVISYDRLIMNSDAVTYYATFDNQEVGRLQAQYLVDSLHLETGNNVNLELYAGSSDDNNAHFFWNGSMEVLGPYIATGQIHIKSGNLKEEACAIPGWSEDESLKRTDGLIEQYNYVPGGTKLHGVLCPADVITGGVIQAFVKAGFESNNIPVITGQDCDKTGVTNMLKGLQSMSIFKDTRVLADRVVQMVDSIAKNEEVEVNDTSTYDNGAIVPKTYLCKPTVVTGRNIKEVLFDSGYYKESDFQL